MVIQRYWNKNCSSVTSPDKNDVVQDEGESKLQAVNNLLKKKQGTADIFDEFHIRPRSIGDEVI